MELPADGQGLNALKHEKGTYILCVFLNSRKFKCQHSFLKTGLKQMCEVMLRLFPPASVAKTRAKRF